MSKMAGAVEIISNKESFELFYNTYIFCLGALASEPSTACEQYGHYNVAWEIHLDVSAGTYLANNPAHRLNPTQIAAIQALSDVLSTLPAAAIKSTDIVDESLTNMSHPAWVTPRAMAVELLVSRRDVSEENLEYFAGFANEP